MERKTKLKIFAVLIILAWIISISGIIKVPALIWLLLIIVTFLFYLSITKDTFRRKGSLEDVVDDMEEYMERKAEKNLGESEEQETSDEEKEEYDFGDDIEIIKE